MNKLLISSLVVVVGNIVWFYAMKAYSDMRQVRLVNATCQSTVELSAIGPLIDRIPYVQFQGKHIKLGYKYKHVGFGRMNKGSGVFVSNDGLILTCYHVTRHSPLLSVSLKGFDAEDKEAKGRITKRKLFAYVVGVDKEADIALLKVIYPGQWFRGVTLRKDAPKGLPVLTVGFPGKFQKNASTGIVSTYFDGYTVTDVVIDHGSSGGGLYDADGRLVGLASTIFFPNGMPVFQGFSGFTDIKAMNALLEKYQ